MAAVAAAHVVSIIWLLLLLSFIGLHIQWMNYLSARRNLNSDIHTHMFTQFTRCVCRLGSLMFDGCCFYAFHACFLSPKTIWLWIMCCCWHSGLLYALLSIRKCMPTLERTHRHIIDKIFFIRIKAHGTGTTIWQMDLLTVVAFSMILNCDGFGHWENRLFENVYSTYRFGFQWGLESKFVMYITITNSQRP